MDHCNDVDPVSPRKYIYILSGVFFFGWSASLLFFSDRDESLRFALKWANDTDCHA